MTILVKNDSIITLKTIGGKNEEFQTKQKSNFFMGLICLIAGALATCVLYFGISRLGYFSSGFSNRNYNFSNGV